jgi:hypothetical protein
MFTPPAIRHVSCDIARPVSPLAYPAPMASAELSRRVEKVVGYPPLCEMGDLQRREFQEALLDADSFEDLPGKWQAAILTAEHNRPKLRLITGD